MHASNPADIARPGRSRVTRSTAPENLPGLTLLGPAAKENVVASRPRARRQRPDSWLDLRVRAPDAIVDLFNTENPDTSMLG